MVIAIEGVATAAVEGFLTSLTQASEALAAIPARLEAARVHDTAFGKLVDAAKVRDAYHERLPATEQNIAEARELIGHLINQFNGVTEPQPELAIAADAGADAEPATELIPAQAVGSELLTAAPGTNESMVADPTAVDPAPAAQPPADELIPAQAVGSELLAAAPGIDESVVADPAAIEPALEAQPSAADLTPAQPTAAEPAPALSLPADSTPDPVEPPLIGPIPPRPAPADPTDEA